MNVLVLTRLFYNIASIGPLTSSEFTFLEGHYIRPWRYVYGTRNYELEQWSNFYMYNELNVTPLVLYLRACRLRYFARILNFAPKLLIILLNHEFLLLAGDSFLGLILDDLQWVSSSPKLSELPDPHISIGP